MINIVSLVLQAAIPLINFFFKRAEHKAEMKRKMFDLAQKYDDQVLKNAKLRSEYEALKKEIFDREKIK